MNGDIILAFLEMWPWLSYQHQLVYATRNYYIARNPSCDYDKIAAVSFHIRILELIRGVNNRYSSSIYTSDPPTLAVELE